MQSYALSSQHKMSLTVEKVISDAKQMASRLKERNLMADEMIIEAKTVAEEIETLRQVRK